MSLPRRFALYHARKALEVIDTQGSLPKNLLKTYSAFANTQGGLIVIGARLTPDAELVPSGLDDPFATIRALWALLNDRAQVSANILCTANVRLDTVGEHSVVVVNVPRARREVLPVYLGRRALGHTYRRVGGQTEVCPAEVVRALERDARQTSDAVPLPDVFLSSLELDTIGAYHDELLRVRPGHPWLELDTPEEFLMRLGAIGRSPQTHLLHPTQAGLLMFGNEERIVQELPFFSLRYVEWRLTPDVPGLTLASDDGTWSGNVFDFWLLVRDRAERAATCTLGEARAGADREEDRPVECAATDGGSREGTGCEGTNPMCATTCASPGHDLDPGDPSGDEEAPGAFASDAPCDADDACGDACKDMGAIGGIVREAVANALAHADYRGRGGVVVACGPQGLCVENAGRLRGEGRAVVTGGLASPRNPALKSMLELVGIGRPAGGGLASMAATCKRDGLRLDLDELIEPDRTTLTLSVGRPLRQPGSQPVLRKHLDPGRARTAA